MQEIRDDNNKLFCKHDIEKHIVEIVKNGIKSKRIKIGRD